PDNLQGDLNTTQSTQSAESGSVNSGDPDVAESPLTELAESVDDNTEPAADDEGPADDGQNKKSQTSTALGKVPWGRLVKHAISIDPRCLLPAQEPRDAAAFRAAMNGISRTDGICLMPSPLVKKLLDQLGAVRGTLVGGSHQKEVVKVLLFNAVFPHIVNVFSGCISMDPESKIEDKQDLLSGYADIRFLTIGGFDILYGEFKRDFHVLTSGT
ncbi:hypothetical protein MPER_08925, partial [Moniliophthora perniciosa FA553]